MSKTQITPAALRAASMGDLGNLIVAMTPGGIEHQERIGQIEQSLSETLPIKGTSAPKDREIFENLGFVFGQNADDIFVSAMFPKGWKKKVTDHAMWSKLVDDKDRVRGSIFYKAAFYDRSAHIHLQPRYSIGRHDSVVGKEGVCEVTIKDGDTVIKKFGEWQNGEGYKGLDTLEKEAMEYMAKTYPDAQNVNAYWH